MNIEELRMLGRDCYAAFNQSPPALSGRAWDLWAEMCADIPVAASQFIRSKIIELDGMPRNFGKAVRQYGQEWRNTKTGGHFVSQACPDCDRETPGFFMAWQKLQNGSFHNFLVRCLCNRGKPIEGMLHMSKGGAINAGYEVVPPGEESGVLLFDLALRGMPVQRGNNDYTKAARNRNFKQRQAHLDAVAETEWWQ